MKADRVGRAVRGALAGALTTFLALAFHVFGGGAFPGVPAIAASLLATAWVGIALAGRRLRVWRLVVSVAIGQLVLHAVFAMATASVVATAAGGHEHGSVVLGAVLHGGHAMAGAHAAAGVVTVAGILLGDRLISAAIRAASRFVALVLVLTAAPPCPLPPRRARVAGPAVPALASRALLVAPRRGPPAALLTA